MIIFVGTVLILSYVMRIFEIPFYRHNKDGMETSMFDNYFNSVWLIVVTITTVGYGTYVPNTYAGKWCAMFAALWGSFMVSLLVLSTSSIFDLTKN
jgi:polar amino acid transport system substrate-binding protein